MCVGPYIHIVRYSYDTVLRSRFSRAFDEATFSGFARWALSTYSLVACACVVLMKPWRLPVDIQHALFPCWFYNSYSEIQAMWPRHYHPEILHCNASRGVDNGMPCHRKWIGQAPRIHAINPYTAEREKKEVHRSGYRRMQKEGS